MLITIAGMIGTGKTSLSSILAESLGTKAFFEPVTDNPVLPEYYKNPKENAFLLQIYFLGKRFDAIKEAMQTNNAIVDRSIYEDALFTKQNYLDGNISQVAMDVYNNLLKSMMSEMGALPKKSPDLMIYIKNDFDTIKSRIKKRGREFEQSDELDEYYKKLLSLYDEFEQDYDASPILTIDGSEYDFVDNIADREAVLNIIYESLLNTKVINSHEYKQLVKTINHTIDQTTYNLRLADAIAR